MYSRRLKIFIGFCLTLVVICLIRLGFMQIGPGHKVALEKVSTMRNKPPVKLPTLRGKILDRKGRTLAIDQPSFHIYLSYKLTKLLDSRWQEAQYIRLLNRSYTPQQANEKLKERYASDIETLYRVLNWCESFTNYSEADLLKRIEKINNNVWRLRSYMAWRNHSPGQPFANFKKEIPDEKIRLSLALQENIMEMYHNFSLIELKTEDEKFNAELAFSNMGGVTISAQAERYYPYESSAPQVIGWVKPRREDYSDQVTELLKDDELAAYQGRELAGFSGIEWVCEPVLRGRRGQVEYNRDGELVDKTQTLFGKDVKLSIDIELQNKLEKMLSDPKQNERFYNHNFAAVIIDVKSAEILSMVSLPVFNLNDVRNKYTQYRNDPNKPLENRGLQKIYPPGSTLKPFVLIAGMEMGLTTASRVISCPAHSAPKGWPNCWLFRQFHSCHDYKWSDAGGNNARNAIKGSCNIYFSRLAHSMDGRQLQKWLYDFGYGRRILEYPTLESTSLDSKQIEELNRRLSESGGAIWSGYAQRNDKPLADLKPINKNEKKFFGMGQGNMRATTLQIANQMATIARGGIFRKPSLFSDNNSQSINLNVSNSAIATVKEGMYAVVNESGGTAKTAFANSKFKKYGVTVYGKTGSTQGSANALFAGFAKDKQGKLIAIAILVEGGESGAQDAAPLCKKVIDICIDTGYIGDKTLAIKKR